MKVKKPARAPRKAPDKAAVVEDATSAAIAKAQRACELLDLTAAAWVTVLRSRVKELADEMGRVDYILGHPDAVAAGKVLPSVIDMKALGRLADAIKTAEECFDDLLSDNVAGDIPNLPNACRVAAAALGMRAKAGGATS